MKSAETFESRRFSFMARLRSRELLCLTLPVFIVAGAGFYASRRGVQVNRNEGPFRVELVSLQRKPVTPYEAYFGYDTKIKAVYRAAGKVPPTSQIRSISLADYGSATLLVQDKSKITRIKSTKTDSERPNTFGIQTTVGRTEGTEINFLINSRRLPSNAQLQLKGHLTAGRYYQIVGGPPVPLKLQATILFKFEVKSKNEHLIIQPISKRRFFQLEAAQVMRDISSAPQETYVRLKFKRLDINTHLGMSLEQPYFTDANGRKYEEDTFGRYITNPSFLENSAKPDQVSVLFDFSPPQLPGPAPHAFHALASFDGCWPLKVQVPIPQKIPLATSYNSS